MRRGPLPNAEPLTVQVVPRQAPFEWATVMDRSTMAAAAVSVCLYHEPLYAEYFPERSYSARFLDRSCQVIDWLAKRNIDLHIFCDQARLADALAFANGDHCSVHLVTTPPAHPFEQHLWRYLGAALPQRYDRVIFRGMDNIILGQEEATCLLRTELHIARAPYVHPQGVYMPMRGSCSLMLPALDSLAAWLQRWQLQPIPGRWQAWHSDELYLGEWFRRCHSQHSVLTLVDRPLPAAFLHEQHTHFAGGRSSETLRIPTAPSVRSQYRADQLHFPTPWFVSPDL